MKNNNSDIPKNNEAAFNKESGADNKEGYSSSVKKIINLFEENGLDKEKKALLTHLSMPANEQHYVLRYHLFLLAKTYYQLVESVANASVNWMDYNLNHYYTMVVKGIKEFLNMPEFKNLHVEFHPLVNLFPGNDLDMAWDLGVRQEIQNFVGDTQSFLNELHLIGVCNSSNVKMMTSHLIKTMEKPSQAANEHSQRSEKGFNKILDKTKREPSESKKTAKQTKDNLPCTKLEVESQQSAPPKSAEAEPEKKAGKKTKTKDRPTQAEMKLRELKVREATNEYHDRYGHKPTAKEIADITPYTVQQIRATSTYITDNKIKKSSGTTKRTFDTVGDSVTPSEQFSGTSELACRTNRLSKANEAIRDKLIDESLTEDAQDEKQHKRYLKNKNKTEEI
jgi:hypothetical protein